MRSVFDSLSTEVRALDPCVTEEFTKLYVAYKAETNFVDVVPQLKKLSLTLNLEFHELHDPRAIASDVTGIGMWGNGDALVSLDSLDDLPYVLGLIRQALDKQLGDA
jgi:predicted transport protein